MPQRKSLRLQAESTPDSRLVVPRQVVKRTVAVLRTRSASWRESACVWAGTSEGRVTGVFFHHELGDDRATALSLELPERAKFALYKTLADRGEVLLSLLHTHPQDWVGLSGIDEKNQVCSRIGFWSIVLPHYGRNPWHNAEVGFHIRCARGWHQFSAAEVADRFEVVE